MVCCSHLAARVPSCGLLLPPPLTHLFSPSNSLSSWKRPHCRAGGHNTPVRSGQGGHGEGPGGARGGSRGGSRGGTDRVRGGTGKVQGGHGEGPGGGHGEDPGGARGGSRGGTGRVLIVGGWQLHTGKPATSQLPFWPASHVPSCWHAVMGRSRLVTHPPAGRSG